MKKNQEIKPEKTFTAQARLPGPVFRRAFTLFDFFFRTYFSLKTSAKQLRAKSGKKWWLVRL
jgi:hypothetical protein